MTRMQKVIMDNPNAVPDLLVHYHCPAEYGLAEAWPPEACPTGGAPCIECWNREIQKEEV